MLSEYQLTITDSYSIPKKYMEMLKNIWEYNGKLKTSKSSKI